MHKPLLDGIRVLDLGRFIAAPYAGQLLADLGAEVVRVERPWPEPDRERGPYVDGQSLYFVTLNRNKPSAAFEMFAEAGRRLLDQLTVVRCFLHSILKMKKHCAGQWRHQGLDRVWQVYQAATTRQFAQHLRRVAEWTPTPRRGAVAQMVLQRCRRRSDFTPADDCPQAQRTSNAVDRRLDYQDRLLYAMRYGHGTTDSARLAVRAMALQWNFHPYGARLRRDQPSRVSPFHDLNSLQYHPNWVHNLLIASSMGGLRH